MKKPYLIFIFTFFIFLSSCGISNEEKIENAITQANQFLTEGQCSDALRVLDEAGYQNENSQYLITYASAQACNTDFSQPNFFANDVKNIGTSINTIFPSLALFSTSKTSSSIDINFVNLQNAINTLLYAGGSTTSSFSNRASIFGLDKAKNISVHAFYMIIAQLGKYLYLHGNTSITTGLKGVRDTNGDLNNCLSDYTTVNSQAARSAASGAGLITPCASDADGHSELQAGATDRKKHLCQGVVLINNFLDILPNLAFSGTNSGTLGSIDDSITDECTNAGLGTICNQRTQSSCEDDETIENIELFFIAIFETMLSD